MSQTISKTYEVQIIGGIFSARKNNAETIDVFQDLDIPPQNIQVVVRLDSKQAKETYTGAVVKAIRNGNMLVAVHNVTNPASILEVS